MEKVSHIKLSLVGKDRIAKWPEGTKVFDIESRNYYEKVGNELQLMIEEEPPAEQKPEVKYDEEGKPIVPEPNTKGNGPIVDEAEIDNIIASGNKLAMVNAYMKIASAKNVIESQKDMANQKIGFIFMGTPEQEEILMTRISEVSEQGIKNAKLDELKEFFTFDGKMVPLNMVDNLDEKDQLKAYRDYLSYLKSTQSIQNEISSKVAEIDTLLSKFPEDMVTASKDMAEWDEYIYNIFKERIDSPEASVEEKKRLERLLTERENAATLKPIVEYVKNEISLGRRNSMIHAFNTRFKDTLEKAENYAANNSFHIYFSMFRGVEAEAGMKDYMDFFVFIFARFVKFNNSTFGKLDNAFIAQISQNLIMLHKGTLKEETKEKMVKGIQKCINLIMGEAKK